MIEVTLIKVYTEVDDHASDIEMFRVFQIVELLIEPQERQTIRLKKGSFYVDDIEQDLKKQRVRLYQFINISHYEFWSKRKEFRETYLPPLLKEGWVELMS